ncbi:MAG: imidazole glycerol phosphate synthase subunit HisH [Gammaproteobacteria bacterium]|nr:MAG: imidazole glycerol phosphate synthase subunit HisH [Gammaproteobacteria bacterium]
MSQVIIIDGGGANIASLQFALERLGANSELTADPDKIRAAERVILPGVGAAADGMQRLIKAGLDTLIPQLTQPLLGICLGMQLLFDSSEEDDATCLGIIPGRTLRFEVADDRPVPHMGWNQIGIIRNSRLLDGIPDDAYFYFVHSYAVGVTANSIACADYGKAFTAITHNNNFMGTQFHPERSGQHGARLLQNFLQLDEAGFD